MIKNPEKQQKNCKRLRAPPRQPRRPQDRKGGKRVSAQKGEEASKFGGHREVNGVKAEGVLGGGELGGGRPDPRLLVPDACRQEAEANNPYIALTRKRPYTLNLGCSPILLTVLNRD